MDVHLLKVPQFGVNDTTAKVVNWVCRDGGKVNLGQQIVTLETTKVIVEIEAEYQGYIVHLVQQDVELEVGEVFCAIVDNVNKVDTIRHLYQNNQVEQQQSIQFEATKKAMSLAQELGVDLSQMSLTGVIREKDVQTFYESQRPVQKRLIPTELVIEDSSCALVIYGAGNGALTVKECVEIVGHYQVVAFLDDDLQGVIDFAELPVLAGHQLEILSHCGVKYCFTEIANWKVRLNIMKRCESVGIEMINVIHPDSYIAPSVIMGCGNHVKSGAHVETNSRIGDGCIIDNGVIIAHDNIISDGCHIAPGVSMGSSINIGRGSVIGIGASISTNVILGQEIIVGVGSAVGMDVPDKTMVEGVPARIVGKRTQEN